MELRNSGKKQKKLVFKQFTPAEKLLASFREVHAIGYKRQFVSPNAKPPKHPLT